MERTTGVEPASAGVAHPRVPRTRPRRRRRRGSRTLTARLMRPACSSSHLRAVDPEGFEPSVSRMRAGCASIALRARWGSRRDLHPFFEDHGLARCSYATTTIRSARRESNSHPSHIRREHSPLCYGRSLSSGRWESNPRPHGPEPRALPLRYTPRVSRAGIEPTSYGLRNRCNTSICYRLEVPSPGIEPGPSAFQADAQTSYARMG